MNGEEWLRIEEAMRQRKLDQKENEDSTAGKDGKHRVRPRGTAPEPRLSDYLKAPIVTPNSLHPRPLDHGRPDQVPLQDCYAS